MVSIRFRWPNLSLKITESHAVHLIYAVIITITFVTAKMKYPIDPQ